MILKILRHNSVLNSIPEKLSVMEVRKIQNHCDGDGNYQLIYQTIHGVRRLTGFRLMFQFPTSCGHSRDKFGVVIFRFGPKIYNSFNYL